MEWFSFFGAIEVSNSIACRVCALKPFDAWKLVFLAFLVGLDSLVFTVLTAKCPDS